MHAIVIITTPDQTKPRRCVIVRAMKSLMRMSKPPFNTNRREHANVRTERAQRVEDNACHLGAWWIGFSEDDAKASAEGASCASGS